MQKTSTYRRTPLWAAVFSILILLSACQQDSRPAGGEEMPDKAIETPEDFDLQEQRQTAARTTQDLMALVEQWNALINEGRYDDLRKLYAEDVNVNGRVISGQQLVSELRQRARQGGLTQEIKDLAIDYRTGSVAKATFHRSTRNGDAVQVDAPFLLLEQNEGEWKIVAIGETKPEERTANVTTCEEAVDSIFRNIPEIRKMLNEDGVKYLLETRPGDKDNTSGRYGFWVYYAPVGAVQTETWGRFQFDAQAGRLYEHDVVEDTYKHLNTVKIDKSTLKRYCK